MSEEEMLQKRLRELAERAYSQSRYTYTGFLSLAEQSVLAGMERELSFIPWQLYGGREGCERQMAGFGSEELFGYPGDFPIALLRVSPVMEKFADKLTHRDFLGAILHLGLERSVAGDILVAGAGAYLFCQEPMADFLCENLVQVKHTHVRCRRAEDIPPELQPKSVERVLTAASERADVVAAALWGKSRSQMLELFRQKKVFINGRETENPSCLLKPGDCLVVRGFGKAYYRGMEGETKKGRCRLRLKVLV